MTEGTGYVQKYVLIQEPLNHYGLEKDWRQVQVGNQQVWLMYIFRICIEFSNGSRVEKKETQSS